MGSVCGTSVSCVPFVAMGKSCRVSKVCVLFVVLALVCVATIALLWTIALTGGDGGDVTTPWDR